MKNDVTSLPGRNNSYSEELTLVYMLLFSQNSENPLFVRRKETLLKTVLNSTLLTEFRESIVRS